MLSVKQACVRLGCDRKTLHKWLRKAGYDANIWETDDLDARLRYLPDDVVGRLAEIHAREANASQEAQSRNLEARIAALEAAIEHARAHARSHFSENVPLTRSGGGSDSMNLTDLPPHPRRPVGPVARKGARPSRFPPLPDGWMAFTTWCSSRGLFARTIERQIAAGKMPQPTRGEWRPGSGGVPIVRAYSPEQIAEADRAVGYIVNADVLPERDTGATRPLVPAGRHTMSVGEDGLGSASD